MPKRLLSWYLAERRFFIDRRCTVAAGTRSSAISISAAIGLSAAGFFSLSFLEFEQSLFPHAATIHKRDQTQEGFPEFPRKVRLSESALRFAFFVDPCSSPSAYRICPCSPKLQEVRSASPQCAESFFFFSMRWPNDLGSMSGSDSLNSA